MNSNRELEECTSPNEYENLYHHNHSIQPQDPRSQEELDQVNCYKFKDICVVVMSVGVISAMIIALIIVLVLRLK